MHLSRKGIEVEDLDAFLQPYLQRQILKWFHDFYDNIPLWTTRIMSICCALQT